MTNFLCALVLVSAAEPGHDDGMRRDRRQDVRGGHLNTERNDRERRLKPGHTPEILYLQAEEGLPSKGGLSQFRMLLAEQVCSAGYRRSCSTNCGCWLAWTSMAVAAWAMMLCLVNSM